jgi:hypothetical protein
MIFVDIQSYAFPGKGIESISEMDPVIVRILLTTMTGIVGR